MKHTSILLLLIVALISIPAPEASAQTIVLDDLTNIAYIPISDPGGQTYDLGIQFGGTLNAMLKFSRSNDRFEFSTDVHVTGGLEITGAFTAPNLLASNSASSGSVLVSRASGTAEWKPPTSTLVWYIDGTLGAGTSQSATVTMPYGFTVTDIDLKVGTAPTGAALIVDINEAGSSLYTTTLPQISAGSTTELGTENLTDASLAQGAEITVDIDQVGSSVAGANLTIMLHGTRHY